jgi:hypothetical protein
MSRSPGSASSQPTKLPPHGSALMASSSHAPGLEGAASTGGTLADVITAVNGDPVHNIRTSRGFSSRLASAARCASRLRETASPGRSRSEWRMFPA